jgi:hypothetical protein
MTKVWKPIDPDEAQSTIAQGMHTGLRKGSDAPSSGPLWRAISESTDSAWSDAAEFTIEGMASMGYRLCKQVDE